MKKSTLCLLMVLALVPQASMALSADSKKKDYDFNELVKEGAEAQTNLHDNLRKHIQTTQDADTEIQAINLEDDSDAPVRVISRSAAKERSRSQARSSRNAIVFEESAPTAIDKMFADDDLKN